MAQVRGGALQLLCRLLLELRADELFHLLRARGLLLVLFPDLAPQAVDLRRGIVLAACIAIDGNVSTQAVVRRGKRCEC